MNRQKNSPKLAGYGAEIPNELSDSENILTFPRRFFIPCKGCGSPFAQRNPRHQLCSDCFYWNRAIRGIIATRRVLREVRK
jgi:hypothetical protein